jgi:hypothetical protein
VKHAFQELPGLAVRSRPVVDLIVEGLDLAPQACLLDTGATDVRMGEHVADLAGIELTRSLAQEVIIGGVRTVGRAARARLELRDEDNDHAWTPTVFFCDPWPWAFGLLGLGGMDPFQVTLAPYEEWVELRRADR